jgi:hypothetical protein
MEDSPVGGSFRLYFWTSGLTALLVLTGIVLFTYLVDPYLIHQWDTELVDRPSPAQQKIMPWVKTYAAYRYRPEVIFLGSSRAEIGLPTNFAPFAGKRVFNLALAGGTFGDALSMLKHTSVFHRPEIVVWGLDYGWLFSENIGNTDFDRTLVAEGPLYPLWRTFLNIKRSISMSMTEDAVKILLGVSEQSCRSLLATYGQKSTQCLERIMKNEGGTAKAFENVLKKSSPSSPPLDYAATLQTLDRVTHDYCRQGTIFRFFIQPNHALAELAYWTERWEEKENWKKALVSVIEKRKQEGCDIRLFDFSGFNSITNEDIPQVTGKDVMNYFWEQSHYRSEVGYIILEQLFATAPRAGSSDFGSELSNETVQQHLHNVRKKRSQYIKNHPFETKNLTL